MKKGFTLIELLVAVSIIAILSTIGLVSFQGTQAKARDAIRKDDLNKLATAVEIYFQKNGQYIPPANSNPDSCGRDTDFFYSGIAPYMSGNMVPREPRTNPKINRPYCYISKNNGQSFRLFAKLEKCIASSNSLCLYQNYNYSIFSDDLTLAPAPGDTALPSATPKPPK